MNYELGEIVRCFIGAPALRPRKRKLMLAVGLILYYFLMGNWGYIIKSPIINEEPWHRHFKSNFIESYAFPLGKSR
jgi:hypothetical protein